MMHASKIQMRRGCENSNDVLEISKIYIKDAQTPGFYSKEKIHDYLKIHPNSIVVDIDPNPYIIPVVSEMGEKYVRSEADEYKKDNLLNLPRE